MQSVPQFQPSLNGPVVRTDVHDLAIANALMRLYFDKFRSLVPKAQAHANAKILPFHNMKILSLAKDFGERREYPCGFISIEKGIPVRAEMPFI